MDIANGTCGAWVLDSHTHEILGPVVAGSSTLKEIFLVPLHDIFKSIKDEMGATKVKFPSAESYLWLAVFFGHVQLVQRLLQKIGITPDSPEDVPVQDVEFRKMRSEKMTMLHWSAAKGNVEICRVLVESGADINARTDSLSTPLHLAASLSHGGASEDSQRRKKKVVEFLLSVAGIEICPLDMQRRTPLEIAEGTGFHGAQKLLKNSSEKKTSSEDLSLTVSSEAGGNSQGDVPVSELQQSCSPTGNPSEDGMASFQWGEEQHDLFKRFQTGNIGRTFQSGAAESSLDVDYEGI